MARPISTRPRPRKSEVPRSMQQTRPFSNYPSLTPLARRAATTPPASCAEDHALTSSTYTTTFTRALPLSTSTFQRFITDSQTDKTTTLTQTVVEASRRTTTEALPVTTTFCVLQVISSASTATSSTPPSSDTTSITTSSTLASPTSNRSATPSSSAASKSTDHKPSKTPAIVAAAVVPVIVFIIVMGLFAVLRGRKSKKQKEEDAAACEATPEAMKTEDQYGEADRIERLRSYPLINVPPRGGFITHNESNRRPTFGQPGGLSTTGYEQPPVRHQYSRPPIVLSQWGRLPATAFGQNGTRNQQGTQQGLYQQAGPPGENQQMGPSAWHQQEGPPCSHQQRRPEAINVQAGLPGALESETTHQAAGAPSTVFPDDSISIVLRTNSPEIVDHTLDGNSQLSTSRDHALALLEGAIPENLATNRSNWRPRDSQEEMERARLQKERRRKHKADEQREREEIQKGLGRRSRRDYALAAELRGLGVTDTNQTDFDIDAVNYEQANLPPRRRKTGNDNNRRPFVGRQEFERSVDEVAEEGTHLPLGEQTREQNARHQERELLERDWQLGIEDGSKLNKQYAADFGGVGGPAPQPQNLRDLSSSDDSHRGPQALAYRGTGFTGHRRNRFPLLGAGLDEVGEDDVDEDEPHLSIGLQSREEHRRYYLRGMDRSRAYAPRGTTSLDQSFNSNRSNAQPRDDYQRDTERSPQHGPPYRPHESTTSIGQSFHSTTWNSQARDNHQRQEVRQIIPGIEVYSRNSPVPLTRANVSQRADDPEADAGSVPKMTEQAREEAGLGSERELMERRLRNDGSWLNWLPSDDQDDQTDQNDRKE